MGVGLMGVGLVGETPVEQPGTPILLFNDECGVCRHLAKWVGKAAQTGSGAPILIEQPIGDDPAALRALNGDLDIWDAYATIHLLMPDGSMKLGGEAVAEVFRRLPSTKWFAWSFAVDLFGFRPFQLILDGGYMVLSDVRPVFGCESCGTPSPWLKPLARMTGWIRSHLGDSRHRPPAPNFTGTGKT